jgi:protein TonB
VAFRIYPLSVLLVKNSLRFLSFVGLLGALAIGQSRAQAGPNAAANTSPPAPAVIKPDSVFINPEVRPQFTGGDKAFMAYLAKSIHYPQQALQRHVSGKVYVSFILSAQGKVQDAHVISGPGSGLNDEALRLVWLMPPWEPGRSNGQPVRVACTVPIAFSSDR